MTWPPPDISGDGTCGYCDRHYPVAALARDCERRHEDEQDG